MDALELVVWFIAGTAGVVALAIVANVLALCIDIEAG